MNLEETTEQLLLPLWDEDPARCARTLVAAAARLSTLLALSPDERWAAFERTLEQARAGQLEVPPELAERAQQLARLQAGLRRVLEGLRGRGLLPAEALESRHALVRLAEACAVGLQMMPGLPTASEGLQAFANMARHLRRADLVHRVVIEGELARFRGEGSACGWCQEPVTAAELGALRSAHPESTDVWHLECRARSVLGGLHHLQGRCHCCGGTLPPDPPKMTRREAARAALAFAAGGVGARRAQGPVH